MSLDKQSLSPHRSICTYIMKFNSFLTTLLLAAFAAGCSNGVYFDDHSSIENRWSKDEPVTFKVGIDDTSQFYNIYFDLRVTKSYPYANAFFFIDTRFPDGSVAHDTLECPLADIEGRWYGKTSARYVDNRYFFRRATRFPMTGTYAFEIRHAMRDTLMTDIKNVGLRFEYASINHDPLP